MGRPISVLLDLVTEWWSGVDTTAAIVHHGTWHDVVVIPGRMAVRVARTPDAEESLRRTVPLLTALAAADLPFATPEPLSPVVHHNGMTALATTVVPGAPRANPGPVDPGVVELLLDALSAVVVPVSGLGAPRQAAGGAGWADAARRYLLPLLAPADADLIEGRIAAAVDVPPVPRPGLVHGDLAGTNLHWDGGRVVGVLDWDLAFAGDPAYDVACLADSVGWGVIGRAVGAETVARARRYRDVFLVESYLTALRQGDAGRAAWVLSILREQLAHGVSEPPTPA